MVNSDEGSHDEETIQVSEHAWNSTRLMDTWDALEEETLDELLVARWDSDQHVVAGDGSAGAGADDSTAEVDFDRHRETTNGA